MSQAAENLGMAMVYTLVGSAKEWLSERFSQDDGDDADEEDEAAKDEVFLFYDFLHLQVDVVCCSFSETCTETPCILSCGSAFHVTLS